MAIPMFNPPKDERTQSGGPRATPSSTPPGVASAPPSAGAGGQARGVPGGKGGALTPGVPPVGQPGTPPLTSPNSFARDLGRNAMELGGRIGGALSNYGPPGAILQTGKEAIGGLSALGSSMNAAAGVGAGALGTAAKATGETLAPIMLGDQGAKAVGLSPPPLSEAEMTTDQLKAAYAASPLPPPMTGGSVPPAVQQAAAEVAAPEEVIPGGGTGATTPPLIPQPGTVGPQLPEGVTPHQISDGTNIFARLTRPEDINQFGVVQYSNSPRGTTAAGMNQDIKQHGAGGSTPGGGNQVTADDLISKSKGRGDGSGKMVANGVSFGGPDLTTAEGRKSVVDAANATKKGATGAKATVKPLTQPSKTPKTPKVEKLDPFTKRKLAREMRMETGDLADDMKRGRISAKQAAVLAPLIKMKYAKLFGIDPGDAAKANAKNNRTDAESAALQLSEAAATEREAMRGASDIEASKARLTRPDLKPVTLTDTDQFGNKTQRIESFDPSSGDTRSAQAATSPTDQRWEQPVFDGFTWVGPEGGDRNDPNNWQENAS